MSKSSPPPFRDAKAWYDHAMQQPSKITQHESEQRAALAREHNQREGIVDPDVLADQQLYIKGKLTRDEYEQYLLLKYSTMIMR